MPLLNPNTHAALRYWILGNVHIGFISEITAKENFLLHVLVKIFPKHAFCLPKIIIAYEHYRKR